MATIPAAGVIASGLVTIPPVTVTIEIAASRAIPTPLHGFPRTSPKAAHPKTMGKRIAAGFWRILIRLKATTMNPTVKAERTEDAIRREYHAEPRSQFAKPI
jgi:hypothetical protein